MKNRNFNHSRNPIIPKENNMGMDGMDGMDEISMSTPCLFNHSRNDGNDWERFGMDGNLKPRKSLFFHSFDADGEVEHQGHLLALTAKGYGRAQLFEWFFGEPSTVIEVTPDYLRNCIFYASCEAMNAAYAQREARND